MHDGRWTLLHRAMAQDIPIPRRLAPSSQPPAPGPKPLPLSALPPGPRA